MPPKKYKSDAEKKAADAERKRLKRASMKMKEINSEWISQILIKMANQIPHKVAVLEARRSADAERRAAKRSAVKEAANILPKRQKYSKYVI